MLQGKVYSEKMVIDKNTKILCHETDHEGVRIVADWVREDLKSVFGYGNAGGQNAQEIIAGTYGKSGLLQELYQDLLILEYLLNCQIL